MHHPDSLRSSPVFSSPSTRAAYVRVLEATNRRRFHSCYTCNEQCTIGRGRETRLASYRYRSECSYAARAKQEEPRQRGEGHRTVSERAPLSFAARSPESITHSSDENGARAARAEGRRRLGK